MGDEITSVNPIDRNGNDKSPKFISLERCWFSGENEKKKNLLLFTGTNLSLSMQVNSIYLARQEAWLYTCLCRKSGHGTSL